MQTPISPHQLFPLLNALAAAGWLVLALAPWQSPWPRRLVVAAAALLAMAYAGLIDAFIAQGRGGFDSLAGVAALFETPGLLLAGWLHYLCFDLLLGLWQREQAARLGISRAWLIPCLFMTFMFGPIGWLAFLALRALKRPATGSVPTVHPTPSTAAR